MSGSTFRYLYNKSIFYISGLTQAFGFGAIRRLITQKKWGRSEKDAQRRADKDRSDSLRILENRLARKDITKAEYEIMKSALTGKKETGNYHETANRKS